MKLNTVWYVTIGARTGTRVFKSAYIGQQENGSNMIPVIDNTNIDNRIETQVIELSWQVEYLDELDQDRRTRISALHKQIKLLKSVISR